MAVNRTAGLIEKFLGSTHLFTLALTEVLEENLLREAESGRVTPAQMKVLKLVSRAKEPSVGDVASFLGVSDAAASKTIDRLVRNGLLERTPGKQDRRSSELALTPRGRRVLEKFESGRQRWLAQVFQRIPAQRLEVSAGVLSELASMIVATSSNSGQICLQCGVYFEDRCLLHEAVRQTCQYRKKSRQSTRLPQGGRTT
ncbi:MAG TPA: MarR family transcriptional regulator [Bryobacteraceae bacterium]|nr:MarR family transcriptional regulator [Bryobacteraceae bacterium]HOL73864.1 MarR family transcriptional regulator [Bryobacteraceae bacterium]HOQ45914.1 MarR family transcriptional regulator [Bryobacteraceae bacterium]HPQ14829.1 MarR family transcriptional regulator [Bryobacteraceae bacterium]HPU73267.1 MarR family transcriptional regulator [Bryobacteraceae bacterium]